MRKLRQVRQVKARIHSGPARGGDRAHVIVNDGVGIESQPFLHPRKPPGKVKAGTTEPRIISALLLLQAHIAETGEAVPEGAEGERYMVFPCEHHHTGKAEFQVPARLAAEFLGVYPRGIRIPMSLQRAKQTFIAKRSYNVGK